MLSVEVGDTPEELVEALASALARPLDDPFATEWVSVPSLGFRSWLRLRLAERLGADGGGAGIVANVEMPFPSSLRWKVLEAHGRHQGRSDGDADPWHVDRLVWTVMEVMADPAADIHDRLRRELLPAGVTLAGRAGPIADLFDRYGVHRPEMLRAWAEGGDVGPDGSPLDAEHRWQPQLYREVRRRTVAHHDGLTPPAERLVEALELARAGALDLAAVGLPPRLFVVGQSTLTAELGPVLAAVGAHREARALLLSPSARTSRRIADEVARTRPGDGGPTSWAFPRATAPSVSREPRHPLLRSWGVRPLESAMLLGAGGVELRTVGEGVEAPLRPTLLQRVQDDLRTDADPDADEGGEPWRGDLLDRSLQVHAASGRSRQVEVLRDAILALLRDVPDLTEGDIAVLCPQLDLYAPVVSAVLGPSAAPGEQPREDELPALRYTLIDREARAFNPVLAAMAAVIDALPGRFDTGTVRDLLHAPAVRERFGLTVDDLGLLADVIERANVRWGLDGPHRRPWGIDPAHRPGSWMAGVDQLLVGIALGDDLRDVPLPGSDEDAPATAAHALAVGGVAPMPLGDGDIAGAGRLAAALRALAHVHRLVHPGAHAPSGPTAAPARTVGEWCELLRTTADLLVAPARGEEWQRARFDDALAELESAASASGGGSTTTPLSQADVRRLLSPALEGPRARADLGLGTVVVARPSLLTGIPFRVVCLLGLDDEALPVGTALGDDLMARVELVGDRDVRGEARAEVLAALSSARDALVITCTSRDVRTGVEVPRSVLLDELLDVLEPTLGIRDREALVEAVVTEHPRQAFDPDCFRRDSGRPPTAFDPTACAGAAAVLQREVDGVRPEAAVLVTHPLPPPPEEGALPVTLDDLRHFFKHPVKRFFQDRLGVSLPEEPEDDVTELPTGLTPLEKADVGRELLHVALTLDLPSDALRHEPGGPRHPAIEPVIAHHRARGTLPPPARADQLVAELATAVAGILARVDAAGARRPGARAHDVALALPSGRRLEGTVVDCIDGPRPGPVHMRFARLKPHQRLGLALDLLALTAVDPETPWRGVLAVRAGGDEPHVEEQWIRGDTPDERRELALHVLDTLVGQRHDGLLAPLPLFDQTSHALVARDRELAAKRASSCWGDPSSTGPSWQAESLDGYHRLAFGTPTYDELCEIVAAGHRLEVEAERLWATVLDVVHVVVCEDPDAEDVAPDGDAPVAAGEGIR